MSAPSESGRQQIGVAKVLSTNSIAPRSCAIDAIAGKSASCIPGLEIVSAKTTLVPRPIAWRSAAGDVRSALLDLHPNLPSSPKSAEVSQYPSVPMTAVSPALSTVRSTMEMAAIPDETASASSAPSSCATARSSERTFGRPSLNKWVSSCERAVCVGRVLERVDRPLEDRLAQRQPHPRGSCLLVKSHQSTPHCCYRTRALTL